MPKGHLPRVIYHQVYYARREMLNTDAYPNPQTVRTNPEHQTLNLWGYNPV